MPFQPVILWTDALILLLVALAIGFGLYAARHEHLREPWRRVVRSRVAIGTLVVLGAYVIIGLADSLHYNPRLPDRLADAEVRYAPEVHSLLDWALGGLRERQEKTYSAPFATHAFVKEAIEQPDGTTLRDYPRLVHGGAHLADPSARGIDIVLRALAGAALAILLWSLLAVALAAWIGRTAGGPGAGWQRVRRRRGPGRGVPWGTLLAVLLVLLLVVCISAVLSSGYHIFGTDKVGEDVFYQALKSIRTGLVIGTLTTLVMLPVAILLGIMAGYFRGLVDDLIQYLYTTLSSIPSVLLIAAAILMLQIYMANHADQFESLVERADLRLLFLCLILGVTSWTSLCRLLRGEALKLREIDYVQASRAMGVGHFRIIGRHILPNVLHIVLITVVLDFSGLVLAEAVLSYVNIGVDPTMNSWGNMINSARLELAREPVVWWSLAAAFAFMFTLVLAANLFADVVRDAFDPRLREGL